MALRTLSWRSSLYLRLFVDLALCNQTLSKLAKVGGIGFETIMSA
jgi:hypothetical protein